jgi:hypothetical protein
MTKSFLRGDEGASLVENSLVVGLMILAAVAILASIQKFTEASWRETRDSMYIASGGSSSGAGAPGPGALPNGAPGNGQGNQGNGLGNGGGSGNPGQGGSQGGSHGGGQAGQASGLHGQGETLQFQLDP